jgi:flagellar M-ring protein FliF
MAVDSNALVGKARDGAKQFAAGFTPGQKAVTIFAIAATAIGGFVLMSYSGKQSYAPLYANLQPTDAANITTYLTSQKIPYQLSDGGTTIMVPAGDVSQERLDLAQQGLPATSDTGLALLDKEGITTSNITQQADYLRALQGELDQTIDSISGVSSADVNIALPASQDFSLNSNNPTGASVMVTMAAGGTLSSGQVQAIVHLVGSSVPGLSADQITVADSNGDLLAGPGVSASDVGGGASAGAGYDAQTEAKVEAILTSVVGMGNADVQVSSTMNNSTVQTITNNLLPGSNGKIPSFCTSTTNNDETYKGTGVPPGGTAGSITAAVGTSSTNTYSNVQTTQQCETSQQTQNVSQGPGGLVSESVAVLVNSKAIPPGTNIKSLEAAAAAAAGVTKADTFAFTVTPFTTSAAQQAAQAAKAAAAQSQKASMNSLIRTAAVFFAIALVFFFVWRSARKSRGAPSVLGPADIEALRASRTVQALPAMPAVAEISATQEAVQVNHFIDSQPEDVANMLRGWINQSDAKGAA